MAEAMRAEIPYYSRAVLNNFQTVTLAQNRRVDITLSSTGQQSVRHFPFCAEDSLTLPSPKAGGRDKTGGK
jgi:hypothetical protein